MCAMLASKDFITDPDRRRVNAALALAGHSVQSWAKEEKMSYRRALRMLRGVEVVTPSYRQRFDAILARYAVTAKRAAPRAAPVAA